MVLGDPAQGVRRRRRRAPERVAALVPVRVAVGNWGSLPLEGGIEAAYRAQLEAADDPGALRAEIEQRLAARAIPFKTAEAFLVEEIIDPRDTRPLLCEFADLAAPLWEPDRPRAAASLTVPAPVRRLPAMRDAMDRLPTTGRARSRSTRPTRGSTCSRERGFVQLRDLPFEIPEDEYLDLEYMDWKSGGDTNFAPIATADGQLDCRGFWNEATSAPTRTRASRATPPRCPTIMRYVESVGAELRACARDQARAAGPRTSLRSFTATTTTDSTPRTTAGSCGAGSSSPTTPTATWC